MVLVYQEENEGVMTEMEAHRREQRRVFQQNLLKEGLQLELEPKENSFDGKTYFLKLHIPWKIKVQYAEVMNLKLPTKRFKTIPMKTWVSLFFTSRPEILYYKVICIINCDTRIAKAGYRRCQRNIEILK